MIQIIWLLTTSQTKALIFCRC